MPSPSAAASARSSRAAAAARSRSAMTGGCPARRWRRHWPRACSASGIEAMRIGRGPTPMLYYAATKLETDGAVMVTGSHNPPDYNGFKMVLGRQAVLRRADPATLGGHGARPATWWTRPWRRSAASTSQPTTSRALLARLGRRRPHAEGGVGQRQRRGGRRAAAAGRRTARRAHRAERRDRRHVPGASSRPDGADEPASS